MTLVLLYYSMKKFTGLHKITNNRGFPKLYKLGNVVTKAKKKMFQMVIETRSLVISSSALPTMLGSWQVLNYILFHASLHYLYLDYFVHQ